MTSAERQSESAESALISLANARMLRQITGPHEAFGHPIADAGP